MFVTPSGNQQQSPRYPNLTLPQPKSNPPQSNTNLLSLIPVRHSVTPDSGAQVILIFLMFILGVILSIVGQVLRLIPTTKDMYMKVLRYIFALFPPCCLGSGFTNLALRSTWSILELKGTGGLPHHTNTPPLTTLTHPLSYYTDTLPLLMD